MNPQRPGVSAAMLESCGVRHIDREESESLMSQPGLGSGLLIPYFDLSKEETGFCRMRLDSPRGQMKYTQPPATGVAMYIPPTGFDLEKKDLYLTEGEFKAMCLAEAGYNAVAISGFFGGLLDKDALSPGFKEILDFTNPDRVIWCGDADTALNGDFYLATERYAQRIPNLQLLRIPYGNPQKACDDIRALSFEDFKYTWESFPVIPAKTDGLAQVQALLELHKDEIDTDDLDTMRRLVKTVSRMAGREGGSLLIDAAITTLGLKKTLFKDAIADARRAVREGMQGEGADLPTDAALFVGRSYCVGGGHTFLADVTKQGKFETLAKDLWTNEVECLGAGRDQIKTAVSQVVRDRLVAWAGDLAGWPKGLHEIAGKRILVTNSPEVVFGTENDKDIFDTTAGAFFKTLLGEEQLPTFVSWLQVARRSLVSDSTYQVGQALVLAGDAGVGKTLAQRVITKCLGGRVANPTEWILGRTRFNSDLAGCEHLMMSDDGIDRFEKSRSALSSKVKKIVANTEIGVEAKFGNTVTLPLSWRLTISCNLSPESIRAVPSIDADNVDKITLLKCYDGWHFEDKLDSLIPIEEDLSDFLYHVDNTWVIPEELRDKRYGVVRRSHPDIDKLVYHDSNDSSLDELLLCWFTENPGEKLHGSSVEIFSHLQGFDCNWLSGPQVLGRRLRVLQDVGSPAFKVSHKIGRSNQKTWTVERVG